MGIGLSLSSLGFQVDICGGGGGSLVGFGGLVRRAGVGLLCGAGVG